VKKFTLTQPTPPRRRCLMALKDEFEYYLANQDALVKQYGGKVIVIKEGAVLGAYATELEAVNATKVNHALGTFLVQKCTPGATDTSMTFHSRVSFRGIGTCPAR